MNDLEYLKEVIARGMVADKGYFAYVHLVACILPKELHEPLAQLFNGPVWDGDVVSKSLRDDLLRLRLAVRCCVKGSQGYTAATYFAGSVSKEIGKIKSGEPARNPAPNHALR